MSEPSHFLYLITFEPHETVLGVYEYAWSSKHQHIRKFGLFVLTSANPHIGPFCTTRGHHTSCISSPPVTRDDAGVYEYAWSSGVYEPHGHQGTNTVSKSVCVFLSRPILNSVRSVCRIIIPLVSHRLHEYETMLGVYKYEWSPKHQHILKVGLPVLKSANP
jgi:hypothetical protein